MPFGNDRFVLASNPKLGGDFGIRSPRSGYTTEVVCGVEGFLALQSDWERLISLDPASSPYTSWNWVASWIECYGHNRDFLTVVCYRGYEVVGIVPFSWKKITTPLELRKMWMLGFHSWVGRNGLTEEPIFAMARDTQEVIWNHVHDRLRQIVDSGRWDSVAYRRFGNGIEGCSLVEKRNGNTEVQNYLRGCEYVDLPDTWEAYLKTISKSMRENIPYYHKKLVKEGIEHSVEVVPFVDLPEAVDDLIRLHKKRTYTDASHQHVDYFGDRRQQRLLKLALIRMAMTGDARLVVLKANGRTIAAQVFLMNQNMLLAHYSGFDPAWSKYSPLFVLQTSVIRQAIEEGFTTLNLLRGNASWQRRWGADARNQILDVTIGRRKFVPRLRQVLRHREGMLIYSVANAPTVRRIRASYRTWQLGLKSA